MDRNRQVGRQALVIGLTLLLLGLAACAAGPNPEVSPDADAGFWLGLWHGLIAPVTFVVSLFTDSVSVYEVANTGGWYDFGYVLGLSVAFGGSAGGGAATSRRARSRR
ncbi:hypothetical protein [Aquipuribacter sp. MA13-6]|uniref:hypothetical protein n=1 Tax=unclassified Aquipuribacter TaxID=2635084 RepID=UPI003EF052C3